MDAREYHETGLVYQATVGHHNYGFWNTKDEALRHIREHAPNAIELEEPPVNPCSLPEGTFYIQERAVLSYT